MTALDDALQRLTAELLVVERVAGERLCMGARLALDDVLLAAHQDRQIRHAWLNDLTVPRDIHNEKHGFPSGLSQGAAASLVDESQPCDSSHGSANLAGETSGGGAASTARHPADTALGGVDSE